MTFWAHVDGGTVTEVVALPDGMIPGMHVFLPARAADMVMCSANVEQGWIRHGDGTLAPRPTLPPTADDLRQYAASRRYRVETGGVPAMGAVLQSDRESQAMIANALAYIQASHAGSVNYKTASGWVTLDAASVQAAALAVGAHVQACFASEQVLDAQIGAGLVTTWAEIDAAPWPANA